MAGEGKRKSGRFDSKGWELLVAFARYVWLASCLTGVEASIISQERVGFGTVVCSIVAWLSAANMFVAEKARCRQNNNI